MKTGWKWILWIAGTLVVISLFTGGDDSSSNAHDNYSAPTSNQLYYSDDSSEYENEEYAIDRYDAISDYWDEIREYVNGTETVEAYSWKSGSYYDLDVDISDGTIEAVYFPNGGHLYFSAEIDSDGEASDYDQNGNSWDFTLDMDSSVVEDAVYEWASDNGYSIQ